MSRARATAAGSGCGSAISAAADTGCASVVSVSMSSGNASTTGPGRPEMAVVQARAMISGMRAASSISVTHFAMLPNTAR